jgi:hypothetical protein
MSAKSIDPQLNQTEETWGVLYDSELGFCIYAKGKKNDELRYATQGTALILEEQEVEIGDDIIIGVKVKNLDVPVRWNGIEIKYRALNVKVDHENTGPIYRHLNEKLSEIIKGNNEEAIQDALNLPKSGEVKLNMMFRSRIK